MEVNIEEILTENQKLKRDILLLQQSLQQSKYIKKAYSDSVRLIKEKDILLEQQLLKTASIFHAQSSIVVVTNGVDIIDVNKTFFENYDYLDLKDFLSKHHCICELFIDKKNTSHLMPQVEGQNWVDFINTNPHISHEAYMIDKFGNEKIYKVTTGDRLNQKSDYHAEVIVFADITELKRQSSLLHSQSRFVAMGEMISMIAHQWRQPLASLNTILSRMEIQVEMDMYSEDSFMKSLRSSAELIQYMTRTIDDFSNFFKSSGDGEAIELKELIDKPRRLMETSLKSNYIDFEVEYKVSPAKKIVVNASQFDQVLLNIYKNALDEFKRRQIENSKISVEVSILNEILKISVCDNAGGIPEDIISKIFEPYFSTKSKNGMGIGLYMSKIIVENHLGGTLHASNNLAGACFQIEVPYLDS